MSLTKKLTWFLIGFCLFFLANNAKAQIINWKPKEKITVKNCVRESNQSYEVCKKLVKLFELSKKYDEVVIGRTYQEGKYKWMYLAYSTVWVADK